MVSFLSSALSMTSSLTVALSASVMRFLNDRSIAVAVAVGFEVYGSRFRVDLKFGKPPSVLASVLEKFHKNTKLVENGHRSTRRRRTAGRIADL